MPYYRFIWTDVAEHKLDEHGVTRDEFEAIVSDPISTTTSRTTGRPIAFGVGDDGRLIACVYEPLDELDIYPITAYEIDE